MPTLQKPSCKKDGASVRRANLYASRYAADEVLKLQKAVSYLRSLPRDVDRRQSYDRAISLIAALRGKMRIIKLGDTTPRASNAALLAPAERVYVFNIASSLYSYNAIAFEVSRHKSQNDDFRCVLELAYPKSYHYVNSVATCDELWSLMSPIA